MNKDEDLFIYVNQYYSLKQQYDEEYQIIKKKILNNISLSKKEKHNEFIKIKPKCISCKRPVGSIFKTKYDDNGRYLIALCGDITNPCALNINISLGLTTKIDNDIKDYENDIDDNKKKIILYKNDALFNFIDKQDVISKFEDINKKLEDDKGIYDYLIYNYIEITNNPETNNMIKNKIIEVYNIINDIKKNINDYNITNNYDFIMNTINIYIKLLLPNIEELNKLKYKNRNVFYDISNNTYHLIEERFLLKDIEQNLNDDIGVITFNKGGINIDLSKDKTKTKKIKNKPKNITKKNIII